MKYKLASFVNFLVLAYLLMLHNSLHADIFLVTNLNDNGPGSFREAINNANQFRDYDEIDATGVTGKIVLTSGALTIIYPLKLDGPGAHYLTISGNDMSAVFVVGIHASQTVINDITIANGFVGGSGSALHSNGDITLNNCIIANNRSSVSAVLSFYYANALLNNCIVSNNINDSGSMTISAVGASLVISKSTISNNRAYGSLIRTSGNLLIENSNITNNEIYPFGMGLITCFDKPSISIKDSIFYNPKTTIPDIDNNCFPLGDSMSF